MIKYSATKESFLFSPKNPENSQQADTMDSFLAVLWGKNGKIFSFK